MTFSPEQTELLKAPLNRSNVKERKMAGRTMSYVEGWHVIAEANRIFGFDGWTSQTILLQETNRDLVDLTGSNGKYQQWRIGYIAKVRITAGGVSREGTGYGSGMGKPEAIGDAVEGAIKEAETDARKRALMTFGSTFGLALYDKEQSEVLDDTKKPATSPTQKPQEAQTPVPAPKPPRQTLGQWMAEAKTAILVSGSSELLSKWLQDNNDKLETLKETNPAIYNTLSVEIQHRKTELERI